MKKHKWEKEIKAWADGAEIEIKYGEHDWEIDYYPNWNSEEVSYRIKPQPKEPKYLYVYADTNGETVLYTEKSPYDPYLGKIKLED